MDEVKRDRLMRLYGIRSPDPIALLSPDPVFEGMIKQFRQEAEDAAGCYWIHDKLYKEGERMDENDNRAGSGVRRDLNGALPQSSMRGEEPLPTQAETYPKQVVITPLNYGYKVRIGCNDFAIETPQKLTKLLLSYLKNPVATEQAWLKGEKESKFFPKFNNEE